ncbi:MucR family transcriptional regulator [Inquilinus limosus]|uniref:MucR family transcriptional regulator n=1 Tax=Inquilinus limosus TaxID=171674 RepID=UPI003F1713A0
MSTLSEGEILSFTRDIIVAHVSNNAVDSESLPDLIRRVHLSLIEAVGMPVPGIAAEANGNAAETSRTDASGTAERQAALPSRPVPAVPISESVTPDYIICLEDGRPFKMMKRWLRATYGMTPEQYRAKWNLPPDYPMVAPNYARSKSVYAKAQGLGTSQLRRTARRRSRANG